MGNVSRINAEAGRIPEDWTITTLGEAFSKIEAGVSVNSDERLPSEYFVLKTSAVHDGIVDSGESKPVVKADYDRLKCPLKKGSIVISRMNTPELVGAVGYNTEDRKDVFLPDRLWQIVEDKDSAFDFQWLNYLLNLPKFRDSVRSTATGTSNSMKNISKERLKGIEIPKPRLEEQRIISGMISDIDQLISQLRDLLRKKENLRKGALQSLLSGEKRLSGFSGEWKETCIRDCGSFINGSTFPLKYQGNSDGLYPFYKVSDLSSPWNEHLLRKANNYINQDVAENLSCSIVPAKAVVFAKIGAAIFLERKRLSSCPCCIDNNMMAFLAYPEYSAEYMWFVFQTISLGTLVEITALPSLSKKAIGAVRINIPQDIKEQRAIADLIMDMDSEIKEIQKKLNKYIFLKTGMMDELLTGKIRLV